jgi:ParB family chromosome partitioning protein
MQTAIANPTNQPTIPMTLITPGKNPRRYFDPDKMAELVDAIRAANGILQPIVVRPVNDRYEIIAGERRYRAAAILNYTEIPAVVREMSDIEAEQAATIENTARDDMSVTEEAVAAGHILERHNGNRIETAAVLGWPESKLNRRLALLNCTEEVMTALDERKIMVGHAELLAACPKEKQNKALANIIKLNLPVNKVRDLMASVTAEFSKAIFDTANCAVCHHNSSQQATLFTTAVDAGRCTNNDCFKKLTAEKIAAIKQDVEEEFPNVRLIEVGDPANYVSIAADGNLGVGEEQLAACKGCGNYGATVSAIPGEEGKVERSICFDSGCHQKKVAARIKADKPVAQANKVKSTAKPGTAAISKGEKKPTVSALSNKVSEYRRKSIWDVAAASELRAQPGKAASFILDLLLTGSGSKVKSNVLHDVFNEIAGSQVFSIGKSSGHPDQVHALTSEQKRHLFTTAAASAVTEIEQDRLKSLLAYLKTDLGKHWKLDEEFLKLLTKSEIEAICTEIGFAAAMKDFKKVIGGKRDEAIKTIIAFDFDWTGKVPSMLAYGDAPTGTDVSIPPEGASGAAEQGEGQEHEEAQPPSEVSVEEGQGESVGHEMPQDDEPFD